jgi:hypothetical protein
MGLDVNIVCKSKCLVKPVEVESHAKYLVTPATLSPKSPKLNMLDMSSVRAIVLRACFITL